MLKKLQIILILIMFSLSCGQISHAEEMPLKEQEHFYLDKTQLVEQQISLLKKRLQEANQDLSYLKEEQKKKILSRDDQTTKYLLYKTKLHLAGVKSDLESINIELTDSHEALSALEKNIQEIENQVNALNIFGHKLFQEDRAQEDMLRSELGYQQNLYQLEKKRLSYLKDLQETESTALQLYSERSSQINAFVKSRKMLHIKEKQVKSELEFQEQQNYWLEKLEYLRDEIASETDKSRYLQLERDIFYANENVNIVYLKTLIARYQDQIRQMRLGAGRSNSIGLLNSLHDQAQALSKQIIRVDALVASRADIIKKRQNVYQSENSLRAKSAEAENQFLELKQRYQDLYQATQHLSERLSNFQASLDKSIQHELAARQGLPGFSSQAWLDLGKEVLMAPVLSFKLIKGFIVSFSQALQNLSLIKAISLVLLELGWIIGILHLRKKWLGFIRTAFEDLMNSKRMLLSLIARHLMLIAFIINLWMIFHGLNLSEQEYGWLLNMSWTALFFRVLFVMARSTLLETTHNDGGHDARLYHRLKILLWGAAITTWITVFLHQLPLIYEITDFFDRLFLGLLLCVSILMLKSWRVVPDLVLHYVDAKKTYLRRVIYLLGLFIPILLFINSLVGLFGFMNLVGIISWYEGIFTLVLMGYFVMRGLLSEAMEALSTVTIQYINNGWLLTEAFLKPFHTVLRIGLFFGAWVVLFLFYGWNQQSPVVEQLTLLMTYPLISILNTVITPLNILGVIFAISLFYWAAKWTREFVFRLLSTKTKDQGIRNSFSILSQYLVVMVGCLICLRVLGIDLHALFLVASGLLIAISFGLRDLVNNFACGLLLLFERPLRVGDIISVNNHEGTVLHIGSRAVTVRTWDHMEVIVPNTEIFNKSFINWTVKDDIVRTVITIKIDRQDNPSDVQRIIFNVLHQHRDVLNDPEPEVLMKDMIDTMCEFEVRYFINIRNVISRVSVRSDVLFALWQAFAEHGVKAPHTRQEILVKPQTVPLLP